MKKKILLITIMVLAFCICLAVSVSATYYVDKDGNVATETDENLAYEFDITTDKHGNYFVYELYLYDTSITTIVLPDFEDISKLYISDWSKCLKIYSIENKGNELTEEMELQNQIKTFDAYEHISLDGANGAQGSFMNWKGLERFIFRGNFSYGSKSGIFAFCDNLREMHFYGQNIAVPDMFVGVIKHNLEGKGLVVFHEGSSGTIKTGAETLPTQPNLNNNFAIIINENIAPSDPNDTRLGKKWGWFSTTTGWELIVAVSSKNDYTEAELEALKTSHGLCSRAETVEGATVMEATVATYCELGYSSHDEIESYAYKNGYINKGTKTTACANGCGLSAEAEIPAIFNYFGYSASMQSTKICVGYGVNSEALELYKDKANVTLDYGVVAIAPISEAEYNPLYIENGEVKAIEYTISASVSNLSTVANFDFVISGVTEDNYETPIVMCAYVYDGAELSYLCVAENNEGESEFMQCDKASAIKFSDYIEEA